jgi:hypothetical protein
LFDIWLAILLLGPILLTGVSGYVSWRRLAYPKLYIVIGVVSLWGIAIAVAVKVLGNIGVAGGAPVGTGDSTSVLGTSMLVFVGIGVAFLLALRYIMRKRSPPAVPHGL